jgi:hypothetical protein
MPPLTERVNFARIVTVLAATFGIALGLCGVTAAIAVVGAAVNQGGLAGMLMFLGYAELAVMILSGAAMVVVVALWIIASFLGNFNHRNADPVRLFERDETKENDEPR